LEQINQYRIDNKLAHNDGSAIDNNQSNDPNTGSNNSNMGATNNQQTRGNASGEVNILKNLISILNKNEATAKNKYISTFFNELRDEQDVKRIAELWNDLVLQITIEIEEIKDYLAGKVEGSTITRLVKQLTDLGILETVFLDNATRYNEDYAQSINNKFRISNIKRYLYTYLFGIPQQIKNEMDIATLEYKDKPANWNISRNYVDKLDGILKNSNEVCTKFVLDKRSNDTGVLFESLCSLIGRNNNELRNMVAKEHGMSCTDKIQFFSKCTNHDLANLLHLVFVITFKEMLTTELLVTENVRSNFAKNKSKNMASNDSEGAINEMDDARNITNAVIDDIETGNNLSGLNQNTKGKLFMEKEPEQKKMLCELLLDIMNNIDNDRAFFDKHSKTMIEENIEKKMEADKEDNLAVMKELDKESRQSLTNMIKLGYTSWKNLSKNENIKLYFTETVDEIGALDPANGDNDMGTFETDEDRERSLLSRAINELGENYTVEQLDAWRERNETSEREDREIMADMDVMPDDDGDDHDVEAGGDDAYF
jgi:hypothetical protein